MARRRRQRRRRGLEICRVQDASLIPSRIRRGVELAPGSTLISRQ
jgi:hypothetical protein